MFFPERLEDRYLQMKEWKYLSSTSLSLTTTMVNLKNPNKLIKNPGTTSKPAQPQNGPPPVHLASKPKPKAKSFAQAAKANISGPKFAPTLSHEDFL